MRYTVTGVIRGSWEIEADSWREAMDAARDDPDIGEKVNENCSDIAIEYVDAVGGEDE